MLRPRSHLHVNMCRNSHARRVSRKCGRQARTQGGGGGGVRGFKHPLCLQFCFVFLCLFVGGGGGGVLACL